MRFPRIEIIRPPLHPGGATQETAVEPSASSECPATQSATGLRTGIPSRSPASVNPSRYVEGARLIVDCGANIGMSALYLSRRYPGAKIIAIEPDAGNFELLQHNTRLVPGVIPVRGAIWPRRTTLSIADPNRSHASYSMTDGQGAGAGNIPSILLADLVAEHGNIDILKMDIEGSEKVLFEDPSCAEWLRHTHWIYIELHDWMRPGCSPAFYRAITRFEFEQLHLGEVVAVRLKHDPPPTA